MNLIELIGKENDILTLALVSEKKSFLEGVLPLQLSEAVLIVS